MVSAFYVSVLHMLSSLQLCVIIFYSPIPLLSYAKIPCFLNLCSYALMQSLSDILSHMLRLRDGSLQDMHVYRKPYIVWNSLLFCNVHSSIYLDLSIFSGFSHL